MSLQHTPERMATLPDGVIAVITVMVLDLKVPTRDWTLPGAV
jgi:uncharacterized membrane protein